jgi:hypothetical protein
MLLHFRHCLGLFLKGREDLYFSIKKNPEMQANIQILRDKIIMYSPLDIFIYLLEM